METATMAMAMARLVIPDHDEDLLATGAEIGD